MKISELNIYPLKSARAQKVSSLQISESGPEGDRQWMLIDENGKFLSQRTVPKMATIEVFDDADSLTVGLGKMFFKVSKKNSFQRRVQVSVWNDTFEAALEPDLYSQGIAQFLGVPCRLVRYAPFSERKVSSVVSDFNPEVRFADGRPVLLTNLESLQDLNSRLANPVGMERFRPNIVISGTKAFEEENWRRIKIGEVVFSQAKKCFRCKIITIDQKTGESEGAEPLKTLAEYRRENGKATFGVLWIPENVGVITAQDTVEVLETFS